MRVVQQLEVESAGGAVTPVFSACDLAVHADQLRRFARRRMRDEALVDDAVQDALVAALESLHSFQGSSSLKTWLLGILAHKIQDAFRREARYVRLAGGPGEEGWRHCDELAAGAADARVRDPVRDLSWCRFSVAVHEAIERLPASLRQVFQMQAIDGLATEDVCRRLGISQANCWVRLHRARRRLSAELADYH